MGSTKHHIVMLPYMALGHLIPFLALAKKIHHTTGFTITIANTPLNIKYLRSTFNSIDLLSGDIHLVELPFSPAAEFGLPPNTESTENVPDYLIGHFFASSIALKTPVHDLLSGIAEKEGKSPLCLISDLALGFWANDVAKSLGIVNLTFSTCGAYGILGVISLWQNLPHRKVINSDSDSNSDEFHVPGFPENCRFHITQLNPFLRNSDGTDVWFKLIQQQFSNSLQSAGWLCNTIEEIEPLGLELLRNYLKIPVWSVGPLLPAEMLADSTEKPSKHVGKQPGIPAEICVAWLDLQQPCSVVYISFGSENSINPAQMMELATGLEKSRKPFIWVIRPPTGFDRKSEFRSEWLPKGFEERITSTKQGLLVRNWGSQLEILSHKSMGAFLSHCGWNSVMESLSQGVPIIGWPLASEQPYNSKMLVEEMGVSVELGRGLESNISSEDVKNIIEEVMDENRKGREMRKKAMEARKLIIESVKENGSSPRVLNDLIAMLLRTKC
ncbi:UDP-glycosyltransferase 92A1-like [Euphorbia lathyris]|uniref:UDP-glycosyltransferase 92A1-like n=1 Tax=Euphorbia lathyris TaxID=212925 RepID=UPI0033144C7F